jgi:molecular chaperone IbpA
MYQITKKYGTSNIVDFLNEIDRYSIGMDGLINRLITAPETNSNYPPYNYIKESAEEFRLEFALAGYSREDFEVYTESNRLFVESKKAECSETDEYLHHGLAKRAFNWNRPLSDDVKVDHVKFENGLLTIKLSKVLPEHQKKKVYDIQ